MKIIALSNGETGKFYASITLVFWLTFVTATLVPLTVLLSIGILISLGCVFTLTKKNQNHGKRPDPINDDRLAEVKLKIDDALHSEHIYMDPQLSVKSLASFIQEPAYIVSQTINVMYGLKFPELINGFRVRKVKKDLSDPSLKHITIEGLAYSAGFNSVSSFYSAFKKETGTTPKKLYSRVTPIE